MKILFILFCLISLNFWSFALASIEDNDSDSNGIYSTMEDSDDQLINFSTFKDELNFLEKKSKEVATFLDQEQTQPKKMEQVDEISLNSSALKKPIINENKPQVKSDEEVNDLLNSDDLKLRPRRIRKR